MSLEAVLDVLSRIAMADSQSYWLVGALTLIAFVIIRTMLPMKGLAVVFAPVIFWGGLTGLYVAGQIGFVASTEKSAHVVVVASLGMIAALFVMMALVRLWDAATRIRQPATNTVAASAAAAPPRF